MTRQYYYRESCCTADHPSGPTCVCWHDEGTGPFPSATEATSESTGFTWRDKPAPPWTAALLPDDALPDDSLVGRMLKPPTTQESSVVQSLAPLPLWRVMDRARVVAALEDDDDGNLCAAEIDALRDWLLQDDLRPAGQAAWEQARLARWDERQRIRAQLTEQARIAREGDGRGPEAGPH